MSALLSLLGESIGVLVGEIVGSVGAKKLKYQENSQLYVNK